MTTIGDPIKVFISYAHDPALPGHQDRALELATSLRLRGIEANIDRYVENTPIHWPIWMAEQVKEAEFVLCLASPLYKERFEQKGDATKGRGARWEGLIITEEMYFNINAGPKKFISVLMDGASVEDIPDLLHPLGYTHYVYPDQDEALYRRITNQPAVVPPPLGPMVIY